MDILDMLQAKAIFEGELFFKPWLRYTLGTAELLSDVAKINKL